ncbi:hypothetical protein [Dehalogenimonas etheniformans]|uniref:hypothetical protein n=1 Tax=Dehalogenimonas etheniformans TaxID=1536648 RepID=UPI0013924451|nr:hypothetical protein [Dehalogenimonas etheniformans]QNT76033.1 hypothetical protein HX448_04670 [Dehalogenimonas etheniformans]
MGTFIGTVFGGFLIALCELWRRVSGRATFEELIPPWAEDLPGNAFTYSRFP